VTSQDDDERCRRARVLLAIHDAFVAGDFDGLTNLLASPVWFKEELPADFGGGFALVYAIYWSSPAFVARLLDAGADVNFAADDGFPALLAALSRDRPPKHDILAMLLERGADTAARGINDWTPLHHAVSLADAEALRMLLEAGADPSLRTRIDQFSTPLEDARAMAFAEGIRLLEAAGG
jgi:ankyrin repeat protein